MTPSPRLLLTIDYEAWFALSRRYDALQTEDRHQLDEELSRKALDPILEILGSCKASFYLVGEMVEWYSELPQKILAAGHEVGFHCHVHRKLNDINEIEKDIIASKSWLQKYNVRGYRSPMINTVEEVYPLLEKHGFLYSSSIYAPTGIALCKSNVWEIPASTFQFFGTPRQFQAPRHMNARLLYGGEFPYSSSFVSGLFRKSVYNIIERELKAGKSPVIFLHPYEIVSPTHWPQRLAADLIRHPSLFPFTLNKSGFLKDLLKNFPTSTMQSYIQELQ